MRICSFSQIPKWDAVACPGTRFENHCSNSNIGALIPLNSFSFVLFHFVVSFKSPFSCFLFSLVLYSLYSFISVMMIFFPWTIFLCFVMLPLILFGCFAIFILESLHFCFVGLLYINESFIFKKSWSTIW